MRLQRSPGSVLWLGFIACICAFYTTTAIDIPLDILGHVNIEQLPTITEQSPGSLIAFPFDESFPVTCEAKGNPQPVFRWVKNGQEFDPFLDPRLVTEENSGTFVIPNNGNLTEYQGTYRCYASNKLGTAISGEIEFIVPNVPKFPKETLDPVVVEEGQPFTLKCDPPKGIPPLQIYWMTINLQHIEQDERVSMGLNGDLYFSHAIEKDSRRDYCCFAAFPRIRTIVQKTAMSVIVKTKKSDMSRENANAILDRRPTFLTPTGDKSQLLLVKGDVLKMECIAEGFPTPQVEWVKIGGELPPKARMESHGKLLIVPTVDEDDMGKYMCKAKNPLGEVLHYFTVTVEEPPEWLLEPESQLSMIGSDVLIKCSARGLPKPRITWRINGVPLRDARAANMKTFDDTIVLHNVKQSDSAVFQCEASNRHGTILSNANIMIMRTPSLRSFSCNIYCKQVEIHVFDTIFHARNFSLGALLSHRSKDESSESLGGPRFSVHENGSLEIYSVTKDAVGQYTCYAEYTVGRSAIDAVLAVKDLPPMILTKEGEEYAAVEGKGLLMHCQVFSSPPSAIAWSKDESSESLGGPRFSVHENGSLEIYRVAKDDVGQYTCYAENTVGRSAIDAVLAVKDPTRIVLPPEDLQILIGSTAQLSCLAEYDKSFSDDFQLLWEKDGVEIAFNYTENPRYFVEDGILQISNISHQDQGVYTCIARSPLDQDTVSVLLMVLDVPDAPEDLVLSEHKSRSVKLKWIPGDDHNSSTTEFIIEYEESQWEPGNWKELQRVPGNHASAVLKLYGHVDYRFRVSGVNSVGRGPASEPTQRYKTPPTAPDKNPENIRIEGHLPHEMDINWEPLPLIEHNGPGLEYKVSYRRQDVEGDWKEHTVKRHSFVVKNTPTFVPYEIKVQARNHQGWAPEPRIVSGFSGEDFPSAAPDDVAVEVMNSSVVKVSWKRVPKDKLHGHLGGYRISWWHLRSLLESKKTHGDKQTLTFPGDRNHAVVPGLTPFSEYILIVMTFNGRGNGPGSHPVNFKTPEGVPEKNPVFKAADVQKHTISLVWAPPVQPNGALTGYLLEYQLINDTEEVGPLQTIDISNPDTLKWTLRDLEPVSKYKVSLRSCTAVGCGPVVSEEYTTTLEASQSAFPSLPSTKSPAIKRTRPTIGLASIHGGISTQSWFIGLMCAIALLTLIVLIACFVNRNKGGKYSVKEKEDLHPDVESQGMNDDTFCEYSDNDEKPLKGSQRSLSREIKAGDSGDSLVDYGEEDAQFNEDGSFIGEYAGKKEKRVSSEIKANAQTPA